MAGNAQGGRTAEITQIVRRPVSEIVPVGTYNDAGEVKSVIDRLSAQAHVVGSVGGIGNIPRGYGIALSAVQLDAEADTYAPSGGADLALKGAALLRLAGMAGITWVPEKSGRLDDGKDPHYARYRAVGKVRDPDGQWREEVREKEVDLRDGGATTQVMRRNAEKKQVWDNNRRRSPTPVEAEANFHRDLDSAREHVAALSESKAKNRVIRALLGIRSTYKTAELAKPFAALKLVFTARFGNTEMDRDAARMITARELGYDAQGAAAMLYGSTAPTAPALTASSVAQIAGIELSPAPPVDQTLPTDSVEAIGDALDADFTEHTPAPAAQPAPEPTTPVTEKRVPFEDLDDGTQLSALLALAELKGIVGDGSGQTPEAKFRALARPSRSKWYAKLLTLPDADDADPEWMR